jgi:hypothetical protein
MHRFLILLLLFPTILVAQKQKPFSGSLTYKITFVDTAFAELIPTTYMTIYTNDTVTRIENETDQLGKQALIKHMELNKSYLLIETPIDNFAIRTDLNKVEETVSKYTFKKKHFKRRIAGLKSNRLEVNHPDFKAPKEFLYLKNTSPKYLNNFLDFPGLPVLFYVITVDGVYKYELTEMKSYLPEKDLFGVPSDYKKVEFSEFLDIIMQYQQTPPPEEGN